MLACAHSGWDHMLANAHTQDGTACYKAEGHDKSPSLLLSYLCDIFHNWVTLHVSFSAQVPWHKARTSSAQKMLLNAVNFTGT
jgi:hypothetical protein